jgi:hypothetical protein
MKPEKIQTEREEWKNEIGKIHKRRKTPGITKLMNSA